MSENGNSDHRIYFCTQESKAANLEWMIMGVGVDTAYEPLKGARRIMCFIYAMDELISSNHIFYSTIRYLIGWG